MVGVKVETVPSLETTGSHAKQVIQAGGLADPRKVICSGDGLQFGYLNESTDVTIDTRQAGPGTLLVYCDGPAGSGKAVCELHDHEDGTFTLSVHAKNQGLHVLHVTYEAVDVPGSPFLVQITSANQVKLSGPGLKDGILDSYCAEFVIDTSEAGPGDMKIRVGGPMGTFLLTTYKEGKKVICTYDPKVTGIYVINVYWNEMHVPGSPYNVFIGRTQEEVRHYQDTQGQDLRY